MTARTRARGCLALLMLVALAVAHWWYWYRPRARAMSPAESELLVQVPPMAVRLWLPYPHQNLGAIDTEGVDPREVLAAAARLAELPPPSLPRLGPFGLPAATEMLVATNAEGDGGVAAVRVYPTVAALARLSGALASNPWLAGGVVEVDGRTARVRWEGRTWWLEQEAAGGPVPPAARVAAREVPPVLALVELAAAEPPFPAGSYALRQEGGGLVLKLDTPEPAGAAALRDAFAPLLLLVRRDREREEALMLFDRDVTLLRGVPAAAAWARPEGADDLLPGGELLSHLADLPSEPLAKGTLVAYDAAALRDAGALAPRLVPLATGTSAPPLSFGLWLQVRPLARRARLLQRLLDDVPLLGDAESRRWADAALVLEAASGYERAACWLAADGTAGELRLLR